MNLQQPITITINGIRRDLHQFRLTIIDIPALKTVRVGIVPFPRLLTIWTGAEYDAAGDYTQAQVEARVLEVLGPDIQKGLEALFVKPPQVNTN